MTLPPTPHLGDRHRALAARTTYRATQAAGRFVWACTIRHRVVNAEATRRPGGFVLACTHLSHLEPFLLSTYVGRPIDWMTRIEFYRNRRVSNYLVRCGTIPTRRQGVSANAVRTAINRVNAGRVVGVCPEGGVVTGPASVCRGGPIKGGACLVAVRTGRPVVPCVVLGSHALLRVAPWLPFRRGRLWIAFGDAIDPPPGPPKAARRAMTETLRVRFGELYRDLLERYGLNDADSP